MATAEQDPKAKAPAAVVEEREYIVFGHVEADGPLPAWCEIKRAKGKTADEARDKIIDSLPLDEQGGPFVTIAARYWQPETFLLETTTTRRRK